MYPGPRARIDLGGRRSPGLDPSGVCYDYYTTAEWVDLSNENEGVTIALPDNTMVQFGDFHW